MPSPPDTIDAHMPFSQTHQFLRSCLWAFALFQEHSVSLKTKRKRTKTRLDPPAPRDSLLAYKKTQLAAQVREERKLRQEMEAQHAKLLEDYVQKDVKIAQLEAELAQYRGYLERLCIQVQQQEHGN